MTQNSRIQIAKKVRFEVFKRDGFSCQYCGAKPPSVVLEVDHIHPVSQGGGNAKDNLITACFSCNRGKSDRLLSSIPESLESRAEEMREKQDQIKAYERLLKSIKRKEDKQINLIEEIFTDYFEGYYFKPKFCESVRIFIQKLPIDEVEMAMRTACQRIKNREAAAKYFCGICWNIIKGKNNG